MSCPKCKTELFCPCKHCVKRRGNGNFNVWKLDEDGLIMSCSVCGFSANAYEWEKYEYNLYVKGKKDNYFLDNNL